MDKAENTIIAIVTGVLGLATFAVILSNNANTVGLVGASATGLTSIIKAAVSPVTGSVP